MNIDVNTKGGLPIYEQIERQIKDHIISGQLKEGDLLPSIRSLAAELKISVITIKRAYEDLEKEGMIYSVQGKGFYVDDPAVDYMKEKRVVGLQDKLADWIAEAKKSGVDIEEAIDMLKILWDV